MSGLTITRFCYSPEGTFGYFDTAAGVRLYTVERPWLENRVAVSCIPEGVYTCQPRRFFRGGYDAVEVTNVPGRSHILFHRANFPRDVQGCIGVGSAWGILDNRLAVLDSRQAFEIFMSDWGGAVFELEVAGPPPAVLEAVIP